jgi:hypothetical protein
MSGIRDVHGTRTFPQETRSDPGGTHDDLGRLDRR